MTFSRISLIVIVIMVSVSSLKANGETTTSKLIYDFDNCQAIRGEGQHSDYSEFVSEGDHGASCDILSSVGPVSRNSPLINTHSCTEGFTGLAMCVSSQVSCDADFTSDHKIVVPFNLRGTAQELSTLTNISFQHRSPDEFYWIQGSSGPNNPPSQFAVRLISNGQVIYSSLGNATNDNWNLFNIPLSGITEAAVNQSTDFVLEILPYCVSGRGSVTAWDIDDLMISASCRVDVPTAASLSTTNGTTEEDICLASPNTSLDFIIEGSDGSNNQLIVTDEQGVIIGLPQVNQIDFGGAPVGVCFVYHLTYDGEVENLEVGSNLQDISGCLALSNSVRVSRITLSEVSIDTDGLLSFEFCEVLPSINVISNNESAQSIWVAVNGNNEIIGVAESVSDFQELAADNFSIARIESLDDLSDIMEGENIANLSGCAVISNLISAQRFSLDIPSITSEQSSYDICSRDGIEDVVVFEGISSQSVDGRFVVVSPAGEIYAVRQDGEINFDGLQLGECFVHYVVFDEEIGGLFAGSNISNLTGCFAVSDNSIAINKVATGGGVFATTSNTTSVTVCRSNGDNMLLETILRNNTFPTIVYPVVDEEGTVLSFLEGPDIDLSQLATGFYRLYALSFDGENTPIEIGENIATLAPSCDVLSNPITLNISEVFASSISTDEGIDIDVCFGGVSETAFIEVIEEGGLSPVSSYLVTDLDGNILSFQTGPTVFVEERNGAECQIWNIRYAGGLRNLGVGNNVGDLMGCFELSNPINVSKNSTVGGVISTSDNRTELQLCSGDAAFSLQLNGNEGGNSLWLITDTDNNLIGWQEENSFDFNDLELGSYRVWHISFDGTFENLNLGNDIAALRADCNNLSNAVNVTIVEGANVGGDISYLGSNSLTICPNNLDQEFLFDLSGSVGGNGVWIVVDDSGVIVRFSNSNSLNLSGISAEEFGVIYVSYTGGLSGLSEGSNFNNLSGCFDISNTVDIVQPLGLSGGLLAFEGLEEEELEVCVGVGVDEQVNLSLSEANGSFNQLIITDENGQILALPEGLILNFEGAPAGTCLVYNVASEELFDTDIVGANISDLQGCFAISNRVSIVRNTPDAGSISIDGTNEITICTDVSASNLEVDYSQDGFGDGLYIVTTEELDILAIQESNVFNFEGVPPGVCLIWRISTLDVIEGLEEGSNAAQLAGCFDLSNAVTIVRESPETMSSAMSSILFGLDNCDATISQREFRSYAEFDGLVENDSGCAEMNVVRGIYRENATTNTHSCTPGVNDGLAMCVSSSSSCTFEDDNELAIRFDVSLAPSESMETATLSSLSFYEQAPEEYTWVNGDSGPNRYPLFFGVRISKNGEEIYHSAENSTSSGWNLQNFDFTELEEFTVDEEAIFSIELLAYCLSDVESTVTAWDIDEVLIKSDCSNAGGCQEDNTAASAVMVQGRVKTHYGEDISHVSMKLGDDGLDLTNNLGLYEIRMPKIEKTYMLSPFKKDEAINGLSVLDIVLAQRHILGIAPLKKEAKMIASDVNSDGKVTASDIVNMRRVLLGMDNEYSNSANWIFYSENAMNSSGEAMTMAPNEVMIDQTNFSSEHNFVGVKVGDLDGSAIVNQYKSRTSSLQYDQLKYNIQAVSDGLYKINIVGYNSSDLYGAQFEFSDIKGDIVELSSDIYTTDNIGAYKGAESFKVILSDGQKHLFNAKNDVLLSLLIQSEERPDIKLVNGYSKVITDDLTEKSISLSLQDQLDYKLNQNEPNPFVQTSVISFSIPEYQKVEITIYDLKGQVQYRSSDWYEAGLNSIKINRNDVNSSGVLIYTMSTNNNVLTKKMILMD